MAYIFIHGLGQRADSWNETLSYMRSLDPIVNLELSQCTSHMECTYDNLYQAFSKRAEECLEPLALCGLSLGGILALHYAIEHPDKVNSLVLIGAQYKVPKLLFTLQGIIFHFMPASSFTKMGYTKKDFIGLTKSMNKLDFRKDLHKVKCETLVICGEKDKANRKAAEQLSEKIEHAHLYVMEKGGHELNVDRPKKLAARLLLFYLRNTM